MDREKRESSPTKQILTALVATIPTFTYGIQIGWLSPMGPLLKSPSTPARAPLVDSDISWMAAALPLAAICGIPFFSLASDKFGRKKCVILVSLLSCISWTIKLTAIMPGTLILARIIAGLAAGGCFVVVPVYIKEISEDHWRGALGSLNMTVCKLGVIFVYAVGMLMSYKANQMVYLSVGAIHVVAFCFMPESPNYLLKIGKEKIPLACSSLVVSVCMTALATCFLLGSESAPWLPVTAVCVCILAYGAGLAPVPLVVMAEVFTFQLRARMAGASMAFSFFCSSMTVLFYTPVANQFGAYVVFYTFAAVTLFGVVYTILWVPETKGKSLEEIRRFWKTEPEPVLV